MPNSGKWRDSARSAKSLSNSGENRKALAMLESALENYPQKAAQIWLSYQKAIVSLKLGELDAVRELVMDLLAPDSPIRDNYSKAILRGWVLNAMSEANDVEGMARLLPDQFTFNTTHALNKQSIIGRLHGQAERIRQHHDLFLDSELITPDAKPASQLVLSKRRPSFRPPAKTHYPASIKRFLDDNPYGPAVSLYTLTNCTAIFWNGYSLFFDAVGGFIRECSDRLPVLLNGKVKDMLKETQPAIPGVSAYIGDRFQNGNYCHWILDWLPRLSLCERAGPFENIVSIRLAADFMRESLDFLGYQDKTIIAINNTPYVWRFETLLVPRDPLKSLKDIYQIRDIYHPMHFCHPDLLQWWRSRCPARKPHRKLYIPRLSKRLVLNEKDLLGLLDGFEVFDPGRHSFAKQIKMFSEAEMVVGAHGAGLTNLLFAPERCRVLELFPGVGGSIAFFCLATALNHDYDLVMAEAPAVLPEEPNNLSFTVPLEQVGQWLQGNV